MSKRPLLLIPLLGFALTAPQGVALIPEVTASYTTTSLAIALEDPQTAEAALRAIRLQGADALPALEDVAFNAPDLSARGRAILAMRDIDTPEASTALRSLTASQHELAVRSWAASALIHRAADLDSLIRLTQQYQHALPATGRPLELKIEQLTANASTVELLKMAATGNQFTQSLGPRLNRVPAQDLVVAMRTHSNDQVRRQAAAYLAARGAQDQHVAAAIIDATRWDPERSELPWAGGALYIPGLQYQRKHAIALIGELIRWNLALRDNPSAQRQVQNNLRSVQLLRAAGFQNAWPDVNGTEVLIEYRRVAGRAALHQILAEQGLSNTEWAAALMNRGTK